MTEICIVGQGGSWVYPTWIVRPKGAGTFGGSTCCTFLLTLRLVFYVNNKGNILPH